MTCAVAIRPSPDPEEAGGSCAEGQLIGMTEWALPHPEPEACSQRRHQAACQ